MSAYPNPAPSPDLRPEPGPDLRLDPERISRLRQTDRLRGLIIVGLTFVLCLLLSVWAKRRSLPVLSAPPGPPSPVGVVGFPDTVDAVKSLARARQLSQRSLLRSISADGVKSDGTIDVSAAPGRIRYSFQSPAGEGPEPPRQPDTLARHPYCGRQNINVHKDGMVAEADVADAICPPHPVDPLPEPRCSLAEIWAHASSRGVPRMLAHIEYYRASAGPAWRFEAPHSRGRFVLYGDCKRELDAKEAVNVGP